MKTNFRTTISMILLILVMCVSLTNTTSVLADEGSPTEPPIPTEVPTDEPTEPPVLPTDLPVDATPVPEEIIATPPAEEAPVEDMLSQIPDDTSIVVLDENGNPVSLASQQAAEIVLSGDPQWCPLGVLPGDPSCSTAYGTIALLIGNMQSNTNFYDEDGIIYFLSGASGGSFSLTTNSIGSNDFSDLRGNDLILQGGWNGLNGASATFTGVTNFGTNTITLGDSHSSNRDWDGNLTLSNFAFSGASSTALSIFVEDGNVALNNITVTDQTNNSYATYVDIDGTGNINIQNSMFDGNAAGTSQGVFANTDNGSLSISNTTFQQSNNSGTSNNYNGATLGGDVITLTNVTAINNDGNGIFMDNPDLVFLNNVVATNNGTDPPNNGTANAVGSGINIDGNNTIIFVSGGTFSNNQRYGVEVTSSDILVLSAPTCSGNNFAASGTGNCYSEAAVIDSQAPNTNITGGPNGLTNNPNPSFSFNGTDNYTPADYLSFECRMDGAGYSACTSSKSYSGLAQGNHTFFVRAKDLSGNVDQTPASRSFTVDSIPPVVTITFPAPNGANGWFITNPVAGSVTATDNITVATLTCSGSGVSTGSLVGGGTLSASRTISVSGSGSHTVTCTASDGASNVSDAETIQIDTANPTANITGGPNGLTNNPSPSFSFNGNDDATPGGSLAFECSMDGAPFASCSSPKGYSALAQGPHTFQVRAIDLAGRVGAAVSRNFIVDSIPPTVTISFPAPNGANGWFTTTPVGGSVTATDNITVASLTCSGSGVSTGSLVGGGTTSASRTISVSGSGSHNVTCTASDGASNVSDSETIRIDTTPPSINYIGRTPNANGAGWNNSPVTLGWLCFDLFGSGAVDLLISETVSSEGSNQSVTGICQDNAGLTSSNTQGGINIDMTKPVITGSRLPAPNGNGWNNTNVVVSFSCADSLSGINTNTVAGATVSAEGAGQSVTNTGTCTDRAGNVATPVTIGGINIDKTAPVITLPVVPPVEATSAAGASVTYSASVTDNLDGSISVSCSPAPGSTFPISTTTVTCTSTDHAGNTAMGFFNVTVRDTTAPVIASHADVSAEATSALGAIVSYTSPSTSDVVDGAGTATCLPASGSQFALGNTTVTCNATDAHGNAATPVTFVVHVVDTTAPVIAFHGDVTAEATSALGAIVPYTSPSTSDAVDGPGTATCLPASGSQFAIGNTTVTCNATDTHGNISTPTTFTVHVVDTIPPVISPHGNETAEATSALGAIVPYTSPSTSDIVDGAGTATCLPVSGSQFALGDTTVTCNATDAHGNSAVPTTFVIHVVDTTPPVISPTGDMFLKIAKKSGDEINYLPPTTTDIVDGTGIATCTPAPGSSFPIGFTIVTCTAVDAHGNTAIPVTFAIDLEYHAASTESITTDLFIPVTGGSTIDLTCITPGSFRVQTEGARFIFNNLCGYQAAVEGVEKDSLPGKSPNSSTFVSSFTVNILKDGKSVKPLPADASINILFEIPAGQQNKNFTVFEWNGKEWVEVAGQKTADGFFNITVTESGTFMFVAKQ